MDAVISALAAYAPIFPEILLAIGATDLLLYAAFGKRNTGERALWKIGRAHV